MTPACPAAITASALIAGVPTLVRLSPAKSVILLRLADGTLVAWRNACPHMGIELDWEPRRLLSRSGRYLQCTGHGALFEPDTGRCIRGPCAGEALIRVPLRIQGDTVLLDPAANGEGPCS
ncbi:MAG TPA: Rieske 2Fe-2S domain-containing protein [Rhodopila sp.]